METEGTLTAGSFWPTLGSLPFVVPEVVHAPLRYVSGATPVPEPILRWQARLARPRRVLARCYVEDRKLYGYRLQLLDEDGASTLVRSDV